MRILTVIPARAGSKRIPGKNMANLGGVPLAQWTIATALELPWPIVVSTDDPEVKALCEKLKAPWLHRPEWAASDTATDRDVVGHALGKYPADCVVYLRPTTPFRSAELIVEAVKAFKGLNHCSGMRSVHKLPESAHKAFTLVSGIRLEPAIDPQRGVDACNIPDQKYPATYVGNGYVDIIIAKTIGEGGTFGSKCAAYITDPVVEIDTPQQLEYARYLATRNRGYEFGMD